MSKRRFKYGNKPCEYAGIKFASHKERDYYIYFKSLEDSGEIKDLRLQVDFELVPGIYEERVKHYVRKPDVTYQHCIQDPIYYRADFVYVSTTTGKEVVVDAKSEATKKNRVYQMKKKMMKALLGLDIVEV